MRYLYGDSSPFPLNENFLETLTHAVDACVGLLHADAALEAARSATEHADNVVAKELGQIDALAMAIAEAVQTQGASEPNSMTEACAIRIAELARSAVEDARRGVSDWREETVSQANAGVPDVMHVLEHFLVRHQLPGTSWGLQWRAGLQGTMPRAQVHAVTQEGLNSTFEVRVPQDHLWALPVRVSTFEKVAVIQMMRKGLFGGAKLKDENLDRYFITQVVHSSERAMMVLSKSGKDPSESIELRIRSGEDARLVATPLDAEGKTNGDPVELVGENANVVMRIWERVESTIADLLWYRRSLRVATLQGTPIRNVQTPALVAKLIIESIAPVVREMRRHSRSSHEITLKRDLGDGRREELFVSQDEILGKLQGLAPEHRILFDSFGLDEPNADEAPRRRRRSGNLRVA